MKVRIALSGLFAFIACAAVPALADESGNFVVQLGQDTLGVEHYQRGARRIEVDQVGRSPRVLARHFSYDLLGDGSFSGFSAVVTAPGDPTPVQTISGTVEGDSLRLTIQNGAAPARKMAVGLPKGTLIASSVSPWAGYEMAIQRLEAGKSDSLRTDLYFLGGGSTYWLSLHKLGRDSVSLSNSHLDVFHVRVDRSGRILGVMPISGTGKVNVTRVAKLDLKDLTASFAAREQAGAPMGMLSPRDTVQVANAGGAALWIDYSRPGKRGREIYGGVVPYGEVWRTGANAATQFKTDKPLDFGGTVVPAGFYTLWTIPASGGWKLLINGETGQWGTEHKTEKDLYTIDMKVSTLPEVVERFTIGVDPQSNGGVLNLDWDTTRASAAFTTQP